MVGDSFIVVFKGNKAYLTPENAMDFEQLGLPEVSSSHNALAYWKIQVLGYDKINYKLSCRVISYNKGHLNFSDSRRKFNDLLQMVQTISFENIDIENALITLKSGSLSEQVTMQAVAAAPKNYTIKDTFSVFITDLTFHNGGVFIEKQFNDFSKKIKLFIANDWIIEEFDAIKEYFSNVLKKKKVSITTLISIIDETVTQEQTQSAEISSINEKFIETVKFSLIKMSINQAKEKQEKIITLENLLEHKSGEKLKLNTLYKDESDLLHDLLEVTDAKHYRHLRHLSELHNVKEMKLMLVLSPLSFLFLISTNDFHYFVWETLNTTEATYIWKSEIKNNLISNQSKAIIKIIESIKSDGKINYLESHENECKRIFHIYEKSNDGFEKWKLELDEYFQ